jgi:phenylalanyl-tRNA synthetase beta chain
MPSVEYDTGDLTHLLGRRIELALLRDSIPMLGVELESIEEGRVQLSVDPNRPDMLSIEGFARALSGFLGFEKGYIEYAMGESGVVLNVDPSVVGVRPAVSAGIALDVELDDYTVKSVMGVQEKLHLTHGRNRMKVAIGVHDLDKVKPPFTYKACDPDSVSFVPLDMSEELTLRQIIAKHPKGRDYAWTLDGRDKYPVFVDANGDVLSLPPIINGELTRLTERSRNLFIELTGTSQQAVDVALNIIASSLADRGAKLQSVELKRN